MSPRPTSSVAITKTKSQPHKSTRTPSASIISPMAQEETLSSRQTMVASTRHTRLPKLHLWLDSFRNEAMTRLRQLSIPAQCSTIVMVQGVTHTLASTKVAWLSTDTNRLSRLISSSKACGKLTGHSHAIRRLVDSPLVCARLQVWPCSQPEQVMRLGARASFDRARCTLARNLTHRWVKWALTSENWTLNYLNQSISVNE